MVKRTIYIDVESGTWGDPSRLRFIEVTDEQLDRIYSTMSDQEIIDGALAGSFDDE